MEHIPRENKIESNEDIESLESGIIQEIVFVRHGATGYKQHFDKNFDGLNDLKEIGVTQAKEAGAYLDKFLDKDKSIKIFSSPRVRAKNTADIIKTQLEQSEQSGEVKLSEAKSLRNTDTRGDDVDVWTTLMAEYQRTGADMDKEYWSGELNDKYGNIVESPSEQTERIHDSFTKMLRIIRKREELGKDNKNIVLVGHNESLNILLQKFGQKLTENDFRIIKTGEVATMKIYSDHVIIKYGEQEYRLDM